MRDLRHRAWPSRARHIACIGLLALMGGVPAAAAAGDARPAAKSDVCKGETVTRDYTAEAMTFRLQLDLAGCRWWDGSARNLVIWLSRDDGAGPASRYAMTPCTSEQGTTCEVSVSLPHPLSETAASYQGEATWEWRDGPQRVAFDTRCTTTPGAEARCD